jgi:serine O-acetyltransferase
LKQDLARITQIGEPTIWLAAWRYFSDVGFKAVLLFRIASALVANGYPRAAKILSAYAVAKTGAEILPGALVGPGFVIKHPVGIVVGTGARLGCNCTLLQSVTVGEKYSPDGRHEYPRIGDDVTILAGAILLGGISVGSGSVVGANAVVLADVPPNVTVVGAPARIISFRSASPSRSEEYPPSGVGHAALGLRSDAHD